MLTGCVQTTLLDGPRTTAPGTVDVDTALAVSDGVWTARSQPAFELPPLRVRVGVADRVEVSVGHSAPFPTSLALKVWAVRGFCDVSVGAGVFAVRTSASIGAWPQLSAWFGCGERALRPVVNANLLVATSTVDAFWNLERTTRVDNEFGPGWVLSAGVGLQWVVHRNLALTPLAHLLIGECTLDIWCRPGRRVGGQLSLAVSLGPQR